MKLTSEQRSEIISEMASSEAGFKEVMCLLLDIMRIHRTGAGQEPNELVQSALSKESECPFLVEEKHSFAPPSFRPPQGACRSRANVSRWEGQRLWRLFR